MKFISILLFVSLWALVLLSCVRSIKSSTECTEQRCAEQKAADAQKKYETTMFWIPDGKGNIRPQFIVTEKAR